MESGAVLVDGQPSLYLTDDVFKRLLTDTGFARLVFEDFGRKNVCIGKLGISNGQGVYEEKTVECEKLEEDESGKGLGYNEKV